MHERKKDNLDVDHKIAENLILKYKKYNININTYRELKCIIPLLIISSLLSIRFILLLKETRLKTINHLFTKKWFISESQSKITN